MLKSTLSLYRLAWYWRIPGKWLIFLLVLLFVCYPNPVLLYRNIGRWRNPNSLVNPNSPALEPLLRDVEQQLGGDRSPGAAFLAVESTVRKQIRYAFDWETWGVTDYFPTVEEIMDKGQEDCDGRAIIAASVLRRLGFEAFVVADFAHAWVQTPQGDLMGPRKAEAVVTGVNGPRFTWVAMREMPDALAFGVAVFPVIREWIILLTAWLLLLGSVGGRAAMLSLGLMVAGLYMLRFASWDFRQPLYWVQTCAWVSLAGGLSVLLTPRRWPWRTRRLADTRVHAPTHADAQ